MFGTGPGPLLLLAFSAAVAGATEAHSFGARLSAPAPSPEPKSRAKPRLARAVETQHPLSSLVQTRKTEEGTADQGHSLGPERSDLRASSLSASRAPSATASPRLRAMRELQGVAGTSLGDPTQAVLTAV